MQSKYLYDLIHSMSKSEKRHIKLSAKAQQGHKKYIHLFELFNNQKIFNEQEILDQITDSSVLKNFSMAKKRLYEKIMHSLRDLRAKKNLKIQALNLISDAEILKEKGLNNLHQKQLRAGLKFTEKHNFRLEKIQLLDEYKNIIQFKSYIEGQPKYITENFDLINNELNTLKEQFDYWKTLYLFWIYRYSNQEKKDELHTLKFSNIKALILQKNIDTSSCLLTQKLHYFLKANFLWESNLLDELIDSNLKLLALIYEESDEVTGEKIGTLGVVALGFIMKEDYEKAMTFLKKKDDLMQSLLQNNTTLEIFNFEIEVIYKLFVLYKTGYTQEYAFLNNIETFLEKEKEIMSKRPSIVSIKTNIAFYYFINGMYRKAKYWTNEVFIHKSKLNPDLIRGQLLYLMLQYEMDNLSIAAYSLRNYKLYHKNGTTYKGIIKIIFTALKEILNYPLFARDAIPLFKKLKHQIQTHETSLSEKRILIFIDFEAWCDSKIQQMSFKDYIQNKNA